MMKTLIIINSLLIFIVGILGLLFVIKGIRKEDNKLINIGLNLATINLMLIAVYVILRTY